MPRRAAPDVLAAGDLSGKLLLDCTNPVSRNLPHLTVGHTTSSGEEVARPAPLRAARSQPSFARSRKTICEGFPTGA